MNYFKTDQTLTINTMNFKDLQPIQILFNKPYNKIKSGLKYIPIISIIPQKGKVRIIQIVILFLSTINSFKTYSQSLVQPTNIPSSNAIGAGMEVANPVNLYTGTIAITIPLKNLNERGIQMPITLNYDGSGVRLEQHPTWVGQNWNLNAGGSIVRIVNNWPDETPIIYMPTQGVFLSANYFSNCKDLLQFKNDESSLKMIANKSSKYSTLYSYCVYGIDYQPDVFIFNFLGFTGQFFLGNDGKWKVSSSQNIKVVFDYNDNSNFDYPFVRYAADGITEYKKTIKGFKLIDDKGTTYIFGYDTNAIEYTIPFFGQNKQVSMNNHWVANAWHLTKVIDKYGVEAYNLKYDRGFFIGNFYNADGTAMSARGDDIELYSSSAYTIATNINLGDSKCSAYQFQEGKVNGWLISPCYLTTIYSQGRVAAEFNRSVSNDLRYTYDGFIKDKNESNFYYLFNSNSTYKYPNADNSKPLSGLKWCKLNSIKFTDNKTITLIYNDSTNSIINERLNLTALEITGDQTLQDHKKNKFKFHYTRFNQLPSFLTKMVDHWGFYNGNPYAIDKLNLDKYHIQREPNPAYSIIGILNRIELPSGGFIDYLYEPHTYMSGGSEKINIAGGLRIKKIINFDGTKTYGKEYRYRNSNMLIENSSGILNFLPTYYYEDKYYDGKSSRISQKVFSVNSIIPSINNDESHIGYSCVQEVAKNGSYIEYKFTTSQTNKDEQSFSFTPSQFHPKSSNKIQRGILLERIDYDSTGIWISKTKNLYSTFGKEKEYFIYSSFANNITDCPTNTTLYYNGGIQKIYFYDFLPIESYTIMNYNNKSILTNKIAFSYNFLNIDNAAGTVLLKETNSKTDRGILQKKYLYPSDFLSNNIQPITKLVDSYRIAEPIEVYSLLNGNPNGYSKVEYLINNNTIYPHKMYSSPNIKNNIKLETTIDKIDDLGNILQISKRGGGIESVIYGYNNRLPIIKIYDVKYEDFINYLNSISISTSALQTSDSTSLLNYIKLIRMDFYKTFPKGYISNTIYKPEIGVVKEFDSRGVCISTEYDSFGIPNLKRDSRNNILNYIETNSTNFIDNRSIAVYKNFATSKLFQKRDCQGSTGTTVLYRVPSNKYSSLISQDNADSLALHEITNNGQNYANANGTCTIPYVKLDYKNIKSSVNASWADIVVEFYQDPLFTTPAYVNNLPIQYTRTEHNTYLGDNSNTGEVICNGNSSTISIGEQISDYWDFYGEFYTMRVDYDLDATSNYHIYNQTFGNKSDSALFYKNDCHGAFTGDKGVFYNVPPNKYFSTISQIDADQKAKDDIAKNGQNYANMYCNCIPRIFRTNSNSVTISANGNPTSVQIETNSDYKISSITGDFISATLDYIKKTVEINCTLNNGVVRSGSITLESGSKQLVISINQEGYGTR